MLRLGKTLDQLLSQKYRITSKEEKDMGGNKNNTISETTARYAACNFSNKIPKEMISQDIKSHQLPIADIPVTFIDKRQLTETWIWASCRERLISGHVKLFC